MTTYRFADCEIDTRLYELRVGGAPVSIAPLIFNLLLYLIENSDRVVTKDELFEKVWQGRVVSEATLSSGIKSARRAIGDDGEVQKHIKTVHGRGFRFTGKLTIVESAETTDRVASLEGTSIIPPEEHARAPTDVPSAEMRDRPSIAVLPFTNMNGDPEQDYFSDGITEDIITELSRFRELFVIARNSSFVFKNQPVDVAEVGRRLGVRYVLEGSVRKSGNRARITGQLIDAATESHIWGDRYDRDLEDIFAVQDEVASIIVSTLVGRVAHARSDQIRRQPTTDLVAYDWFVQGRERFYTATSDGNIQAQEMFEKAIALDPDYAGAYALLAETYMRDWLTFWNEPVKTSYECAWSYANRSVALDDTDSQTHAALGIAYLLDGDSSQAYVRLSKALSLNPNDTHALFYLARNDVCLGNLDPALERVTQARCRNPFGKYDWLLVLIHYLRTKYHDALTVMRGIQDPPPIMLSWLAAAYAQAGDMENARGVAGRFISIAMQKLTASGTPIPDNWLEFVTDRYQLKRSEDREHFTEGLEKSGFSRSKGRSRGQRR